MAEPDRDPGKTTPAHGATQPDPTPNQGRAGAVLSFAVTAAIVVALLGVMYGVTAHRVEVQEAHRQSDMQHSPGPSVQSALPGAPTSGG